MQFWDELVVIYCVRHILLDLTIEYMHSNLFMYSKALVPKLFQSTTPFEWKFFVIATWATQTPNITCIFDLSSLDKGIGVSATLPPPDAQCFPGSIRFTCVLHLQSASVFLSSQFLYTVIFFVQLICTQNIYYMSVCPWFLFLFFWTGFPCPNRGFNDRGCRMLYRL